MLKCSIVPSSTFKELHEVTNKQYPLYKNFSFFIYLKQIDYEFMIRDNRLGI